MIISAQDICYKVGVDALNIRTAPSLDAQTIAKYYEGETVCELSREGEWIQSDLGWVFKDERTLVPINPEDINYTKEGIKTYTEPFLKKSDRKKEENGTPATLKESLEQAINKNYLLKESGERVRQFDYRTDEARSGYYPNVNLNIDGKKVLSDSDSMGHENYDGYNGYARVIQNLYDGGATSSSVNRYKKLQNESLKKYVSTLEFEMLKVIESYLEVVYQREAFFEAQENMEVLQEILNIVTIKMENGAATLAEESSIRASVADANKSLVRIESKYADAVNEYEFLTSTAIDTLNPFEKDFSVHISDFDTIFDGILTGNAEISSLEKRYEAKKEELRYERSSYKPKIDLVGTYGHENSYGGGDGYKREGKVILQLSQKIFDGFATDSIVKRVMSEMSEIRYKILYETRRLKYEAQKLYNSVQTLKDTYENSEVELKATDEMVNSYWEKFRYSSQDLFILLSAQKSLFEIKFDRLQYKKNQLIDSFKLLSLEGKLTEYFDIKEVPR